MSKLLGFNFELGSRTNDSFLFKKHIYFITLLCYFPSFSITFHFESLAESYVLFLIQKRNFTPHIDHRNLAIKQILIQSNKGL